MIFWTRLISIWHLGVRIATEQRERFFQQGCDAPQSQGHAWQQALQARSRVSAVASARLSVIRPPKTSRLPDIVTVEQAQALFVTSVNI